MSHSAEFAVILAGGLAGGGIPGMATAVAAVVPDTNAHRSRRNFWRQRQVSRMLALARQADAARVSESTRW
jgi:hypothetical protein